MSLHCDRLQLIIMQDLRVDSSGPNRRAETHCLCDGKPCPDFVSGDWRYKDVHMICRWCSCVARRRGGAAGSGPAG
jgi:hypothetical protein